MSPLLSRSGREGDHPALIAASRQISRQVFKHDFWTLILKQCTSSTYRKYLLAAKAFLCSMYNMQLACEFCTVCTRYSPSWLCAISKLRAHENLDTPEHMTNCKAHGRNSHLYHLLYLDAGWHFLSNKECHLLSLIEFFAFQIFITKFPANKKVPTNSGRPASHVPVWAMLIGQQSALQKACQT